MLENNCVDVLQPDITWMGGITEAKKVVSMASAYDIPVIPHGSSVYSYHLQMAYTNCPIAEMIVLSPKADRIHPLFGNLFLDEPLPKNGYVTLDPNKYGFGVTLNPDLKLRRPYTPDANENRTLNQILAEKMSKVPQNWLNKHSQGPAKLSSKL